MSIPTVLLSLRVLLSNPNPDDPLLVEVVSDPSQVLKFAELKGVEKCC